jgi:peptidyl-prolyl cis-trans isomerase SurA
MRKPFALLIALSAAAAVALPAAVVAQGQPAAATAGPVPLDRVVAVVGSDPIMESEVAEAIIQRQQADSNFKLPTDSAGWASFQSNIINGLIDQRLLLQQAKAEKLSIADSVLAPNVDAQIAHTRSLFPSEAQYRSELAKAGLGTPDEYRTFLIEQLRNGQLQQEVTAKLRRDGKILPVSVSAEEVQQAFDGIRGGLGNRPATFTWHQIVINPQPSAKEKAVAKAHADSLRAELVAGGDFARIAKRESADSTTREVGGDLGWNRRGSGLVPSFEQWLFALQPGQISPVFETPFGYHIVRVDRVNGPERKSRHILIRPSTDSADVARAHTLADSVRQMWLAGVSFDTLAAQYHDYASREETSVLTPYPFDSLPQTYQDAFAGLKPSDAVVFTIANTQTPWVPKFVVARIDTYEPGGPLTLADVRSRLRSNLEQTAAIRRYLDGLRKTTFVEIKPGALAPPPGAMNGAGSSPP